MYSYFMEISVIEDIALPDDFPTISAESAMCALLKPLRYVGTTNYGAVSGRAFDDLRSAYLKTQENNFLGYCTICTAPVLSQQQFLRVYRSPSNLLPVLSHIICEERKFSQTALEEVSESEYEVHVELHDAKNTISSLGNILEMAELKIRYQSREIEALQTALLDVRRALSNFNFVEREEPHAVENREVKLSRVIEHPYGDQGRGTTEAGGCHRPLESRQGEAKEQSVVQEGQGTVKEIKFKWAEPPAGYEITHPGNIVSPCCQ